MVKVRGYSYQPNVSTEYTRFRADYFSGADVRIYFGDIWVDEITGLQFTLQEQVAPIYGYASYTWDKVARGTRLIQGSFRINFRESYYLHSVMDRLSSKVREASDGTSGFEESKWKQGLNIEHILKEVESNSFESIADEFEKTLWGAGQNSKFNKIVKNREHNTYFYPEHRGPDKDGHVTYDSNVSQKALAENGFNIVITYGPMHAENGMRASQTVHTLIGVQLTGVSQIIGGDGAPIEEEYQFIARDLDNDVTITTKKVQPSGGGYIPPKIEDIPDYSLKDSWGSGSSRSGSLNSPDKRNMSGNPLPIPDNLT